MSRRSDSLPRLGIDLGPAVPGWSIRLAAALLPALTLGGQVLTRLDYLPGALRTVTFIWLLGGMIGSLAVPNYVVPMLSLLPLALVTLFAPPTWLTLAWAALAYLGIRLGTWAKLLAGADRVEWAVLGRLALAEVPALAIGAALTTLALSLRGNYPWAMSLGAGALAVAGLLLVPGLRHRSEKSE